jgi:hypothetical protein
MTMEIRPVSDLRNKFSEIEKKLKKENQYILLKTDMEVWLY